MWSHLKKLINGKGIKLSLKPSSDHLLEILFKIVYFVLNDLVN